VGVLIIRCRRLLLNAITRRLEEAGESMHLYRLLAELARGGPAPQRDLAEATAQHAAAISRLVEDLEGMGLIRRRRGDQDRRQIIVAITERGRQRYQATRPMVLAAMEEVLAPLVAHQRQRLAELLNALLQAHPAPASSLGRSKPRRRRTPAAKTSAAKRSRAPR
jgi:DNA-binding MarR family transcriptional regulator